MNLRRRDMRRNNNNKQKLRGGNKRNSPANPPQLPTNVQVVHTYRFRSTSDTAQNITQNDLRGIAGAVCDVANTSVRLIASGVKVHKVEVWTPPASQGASASCSIAWTSPDASFTQNVEVSDTTISVSRPAHVKAKPPPFSAASFWLGAGSDTMCTITAPTGSIIDVHCTHVLYDSQLAGTLLTVAAGTLGALYYMPLDGVSDVYLPVSLGTTT